MEHEHVLSGLAERRARLSGEIAVLKARIAVIAADVERIDAVIRMFDPGYDTDGIKAKRTRAPDSAGRGEMARFVLGVLREAREPVPIVAMAKRLLAERQMDPADAGLARTASKRLADALRVQEQNGTVRGLREPGRPVLWELTG